MNEWSDLWPFIFYSEENTESENSDGEFVTRKTFEKMEALETKN